MGCALGLTAGVGRAEPVDRCQRKAECRVHSDNGIAASAKRDYQQALSEFQAAYAAEPAPRLLLNIGRSLYWLGRPQEALDYYRRYRKDVNSLDVEAEKVVKRYELDALIAVTPDDGPEPPPAPLRVPPNRWPPKAAIGLLGAGVGLLAIGIGLGGGAISTGNQFSQAANNFTVFGPTAQDVQSRGLNMQMSGIAFDVFGVLALGAGVASIVTWAYMKKSMERADTGQSASPGAGTVSSTLGSAGVSFGGM